MATENKDKAVLHYPGGEYEMDIMRATEGNDGVVLGKLLGETGLVTFDPGYVSTGSTESKITYIDGDATDFMNRVKNKEKGVRLMGFGHRVYKNYDPRAAIVKDTAHEVLEHLGGDELLDLAMKLEEIALNDEYFIQRKLYPNVDFYTGLIYRAMGFPTDFFTVLFAIGRLPGWIAQYREQLEMNTKINRPRQIYTGYQKRDFVPRDQR